VKDFEKYLRTNLRLLILEFRERKQAELYFLRRGVTFFFIVIRGAVTFCSWAL